MQRSQAILIFGIPQISKTSSWHNISGSAASRPHEHFIAVTAQLGYKASNWRFDFCPEFLHSIEANAGDASESKPDRAPPKRLQRRATSAHELRPDRCSYLRRLANKLQPQAPHGDLHEPASLLCDSMRSLDSHRV